jgi:hypothetical protein
MTEHLTPEQHSGTVGGSTAARRMGCPRSLHLEKLVPCRTDAGVYAHEGTALHEMMALILRGGREPAELLPFTFTKDDTPTEKGFTFTVDADLWAEKGQPALDAFDGFVEQVEELYGEPFSFLVEQRVEFPGIPGAFGTSDVVGLCGDEVFIIDWKFGRSVVTAEENAQLMFYALGALNTCAGFLGGDLHPARAVTCAIIQPTSEDVLDEWQTDVGTLRAMGEELIEAVRKATTMGDAAPIAKGPWCKFADCKAICPLHIRDAEEMQAKFARLQKRLDDETEARARDAAPPPFDWGEALGELLDLAEAVEDWAAQVVKMAHAAAQDGMAIPGRVLVPGQPGNRQWAVEEAEVVRFFKGRKFKLDDYMPRKLLSPAQGEKLLASTGRKLPDEMTVRPPSKGFRLLRDKGQPKAVLTADRIGALAARLERITGEP